VEHLVRIEVDAPVKDALDVLQGETVLVIVYPDGRCIDRSEVVDKP